MLAVTDTQVQKLFHVQKHAEWSLQLRPPREGERQPGVNRVGRLAPH